MTPLSLVTRNLGLGVRCWECGDPGCVVEYLLCVGLGFLLLVRGDEDEDEEVYGLVRVGMVLACLSGMYRS